MYTFSKILSISFAIAFAMAGTAALVGAIFYDATHQLLMAAISTIVVIICISDAKNTKKNANSKS